MTASVLIYASPNDTHYQAVDWALRRADIEAQLIYGHSFPSSEQQSALLSNSKSSHYCYDALGQKIDMFAAQTIWFRRAVQPKASSEIADCDQQIALNEANMFTQGMRSIACQKQRWINPPDIEAQANRKPLQLFTASASGLKIPPTLMSNTPADIKSFIESAPGRVIYKPFTSMIWGNEDAIATLYANTICLDDIENWDLLTLTAHLFQHYVEKEFELRVLYLEGKTLAYKLHSQSNEQSKIDWRKLNSGALSPEPYELPASVHQALNAFMRSLGLVFGAVDMIVTPRGEHVFLECNPAGQFLFLESWNPELNILAVFSRFLTQNLNINKSQQDKLQSSRFVDFLESDERDVHYDWLAARYPVPYDPGHITSEADKYG